MRISKPDPRNKHNKTEDYLFYKMSTFYVENFLQVLCTSETGHITHSVYNVTHFFFFAPTSQQMNKISYFTSSLLSKSPRESSS